MKSREQILERIQKLMSIANDDASSENEMQMAFERAQKLATENAIEEWEMEHSGESIKEPIIDKSVIMHAGHFNDASIDLACVIGMHNNVRVLSRKYHDEAWSNKQRKIVKRLKKTEALFIGRESDINRVITLWTQLELFRSLHWSRDYNDWIGISSYQYRKSYYAGFLTNIDERLESLSRQYSNNKEMVVSRTKDIDDYLESWVIGDQKRRKPTINEQAYNKGVQDAGRADIGSKRINNPLAITA